MRHALKQHPKTLCIYHGNCADGFGAAWVIRRWLGQQSVDFHPGVYQDPPPDVTDREVILVDFSYKRPVLLKMAETAKSITVIDHHKTAQKDLEGIEDEARERGLAPVMVDFDMGHSGAMLAWRHCFADDLPPPLLYHIEDRDLWRFELPQTREIQAALFSYPYDFHIWDRLMYADTAELAADGAAILRAHDKNVAELVRRNQRKLNIGGYVVPCLNAPYFFTSDAGHMMAQNAPFACCYWDTPEGTVYSLRSHDDGVDVSEVAAKYGGGGHRNAAGFRLPLGVLP